MAATISLRARAPGEGGDAPGYPTAGAITGRETVIRVVGGPSHAIWSHSRWWHTTWTAERHGFQRTARASGAGAPVGLPLAVDRTRLPRARMAPHRGVGPRRSRGQRYGAGDGWPAASVSPRGAGGADRNARRYL